MFDCDPMHCNCLSPLSVGFPRQEYWSGLPFPSPGDLPNPGIEPTSPVSLALQADSFMLSFMLTGDVFPLYGSTFQGRHYGFKSRNWVITYL